MGRKMLSEPDIFSRAALAVAPDMAIIATTTADTAGLTVGCGSAYKTSAAPRNRNSARYSSEGACPDLPQGLLDSPAASVCRSPERVIRLGGGRHVRFEVALEGTSSARLQARVLGLPPKRVAVIRITV